MKAQEIFTPERRAAIKQAIADAEKITSGEIRVFVDNACPGDVLNQAAHIFRKLDMHKTQLRNGVLIYISISDKKFAIIGDAGINEKVKTGFWDEIVAGMKNYLARMAVVEGIIYAINETGKALSEHFPCSHDDKDELSDEIHFGNA